ncbi:MAG: P1 family peptidase [Bryobacterales bacterium]|nr:P1 family peptidase [Bryobacterales bacterium]
MKLATFLLIAAALCAQTKPRARELGARFSGDPGPFNAITDVAGVTVGHETIIRDGTAIVRTGVTAIWPRGKENRDPAFGGWFSLNGNGEMTGTAWVEESGLVDGPVMITNTHSVGVVRDAYIRWLVAGGSRPGTNQRGTAFFALPIVAETYDGYLNDTNGFHVEPEHVYKALESARGGVVPEGNVGGGTGMRCYGFKGGIGTASRRAGAYTVGALVQCNCGARQQLMIGGVPVGAEIPVTTPVARGEEWTREDVGSIIIVIATDAPLLPHQLKRLARRATMGLARTGATSGNGSGDLFIAFSTANAGAGKETGLSTLTMMANDDLNPVFSATVESVEEAIVNAMVAAEDMTGFRGKAEAISHGRLREIFRKYGRN